MTGLQRGTVRLEEHQETWRIEAETTIEQLKNLLGGVACEIQHVGSTSVQGISAKPILDIAVGVADMNTVEPMREQLESSGFIFRGEDHDGQLLFVMGDFNTDIRTHHIHFVPFQGEAWGNYLKFRDYLNANKPKAVEYDNLKQQLAEQFPQDRGRYTAGKQVLIERFLQEATEWKKCVSK